MKFDKKKLLEIAKANVIKASFQLEYTNIKVDDNNPTALSTKTNSTKSINELVEYCKKISNDVDANDSLESSRCNHPFIIQEAKDPFEFKLDQLKTKIKESPPKEIHAQFPVSSGCDHRNKEHTDVTKTTPTESNQITVTTCDTDIKQTASLVEESDVDLQISKLITQRIESMKRISQNPNDFEAHTLLQDTNSKLQEWANSKQIPGQFTGSVGAKFLAPHELEGQYIAWARKDLMSKATPITEGIGKKLLEKMGWREGEGLGKKKEGPINPLALDIKTDRKGLVSHEETVKSKAIDLSSFPENKHPINTLIEYCKVKKWSTPNFELVSESGPPHLRVFLMKVSVNNVEYQPASGSTTKKMAKTNAAIACLQTLGILS